MECSMCGDVGLQIYFFQCTKCQWRFQHQYCSRAYFENVSAENRCDLCDWCYNTEESSGSDIKPISREAVERVRNCVGFGECLKLTHNGKVKKDLKKCCAAINGQMPRKVKKQKKSGLGYNDRRVRRRYKLLNEIIC
ncbi:hypothetical protein SUGI_1134420 [Cryptomeria japonica]|nr:hypothetical protein SUGI_1134420 [Cryptomeria japonica]